MKEKQLNCKVFKLMILFALFFSKTVIKHCLNILYNSVLKLSRLLGILTDHSGYTQRFLVFLVFVHIEIHAVMLPTYLPTLN